MSYPFRSIMANIGIDKSDRYTKKNAPKQFRKKIIKNENDPWIIYLEGYLYQHGYMGYPKCNDSAMFQYMRCFHTVGPAVFYFAIIAFDCNMKEEAMELFRIIVHDDDNVLEYTSSDSKSVIVTLAKQYLEK
jgi:hypothetical protein